MLWILPWSESIKKRACRYLLQRYLGNFLEEKLTLDQLSVDLYNGTGTVCDVSLDCEALNEVGDRQNWPLQIVDGHMSKIALTIPWATLLKDDSIVEVSGLSVTVQPKVRTEQVSSMLESMWSSMSSSMQLAEECLRAEDGPSESHPVEGIEMFAQAIDSILCRVKVKFTDTKIRIEHVPKNSDRGIALEIHIAKIDYFDEAGTEPTPETTDPDKPKTYIVSTFTNKKIKFEGVTLYTDEFPAKMRTMSRSLVMDKSVSSQPEKENETENCQSTMSDVFYETRSIISSIDDPVKHLEDEKPATVFLTETIEDKSVTSVPILFAELTGQQELSLKMKHAEEVEGPKVEINMLFGSLVVFLSPRQLHTLIELADALSQPDLEDTSNLPLRPSGVGQCKPMKQADYQLIEAQLLGRLEKASTRQAGAYGWSGPSLDDSDTESEKFLPMTSQNQMTESFTSSVSSMSGSMTSSVNVPAARPKRNRKVPHIDGDPTAEVSHIYFRMNSLACILLHKNILRSTPIVSDCVSPSSAIEMHKVSSEFFNRLEPILVGEGGKTEFDAANEAINKATDLNHLRLITSELSLDGSEKVTTQGSQTMCEASISRLLLRECLYAQPGSTGPEGFDLIRFYSQEKEEANKKPSASRSNIRMNFKQTSKFVRSAGEQKLVNPTTDVTVRCMPFYVDIELSVIDRMCATFFDSRAPPAAASSKATAQNHFNFNMQTSMVNLGLRFPIPDLRPTVNREIRSVRPDYLVFKLKNATISCHQVASVHAMPTTVSLKTTMLDLYYHENDHLPATHIARSTMDDHAEANILKASLSTSLPTISLTFQPKKPSNGPFDPFSDDDHIFRSTNNNPMTTSIYIMNNVRSTGPSPFSSKRSAYHSFTKQNNNNRNGKGQDEELIVPGNEEEMAEFTNSTVNLSKIHLDFHLPILSLQLESKQLYEIIYNRISSDLLLWEPLTVDPFEISPHAGPINPAAFSECKPSGLDSDTETESSEEDNMYYSTYDNKLKKGIGNSRAFEEKDTHNFCLTLKVGKGLLTIYAPVRDSNKRVVPGQMGELVLEAQKLSLCQVSGLNGRPKTAQLCLRTGKTILYHESLLSIPSEKPGLRTYGNTLPAYLKQTIYPSGKGVQLKERKLIKDMFTLALKAEPDLENTTLKTITVSLGIESATLRHRGDKGLSWLSQLMDVLDVVEYPVAGAVVGTVLSQLHVHVCNTALDYRPIYLPIRAVVTIGNFNFSSNLIPETNTSCLRFIAQDCLLFLSYIHGTKPNVAVPQDEDKTPNLQKDYVCVVDMELFELSLRMEDKSGVTDQPLVDLSASNNMLNLRTCWDSASALCRLLTYAASDGDCQPPIELSSRHTSICSDQLIDTLVGIDDKPSEEIRELSPSEIQQVNDLMAEAMKESPNTTLDDDELNSSSEKEDVKIYFFPDESNTKTARRRFSTDSVEMSLSAQPLSFDEFQSALPEDLQELKQNSNVARDLGQSLPKTMVRKSSRLKKKSSSDGNNTDDEFCIIDQVPKRDGDVSKPMQKQLSDCHAELNIEPPSVKSDVLEAPKYFPAPVLRYKLCEMSINWVLFGGSDFSPPDKVPKKSVTIDVESRKESPILNKRNKTYEPYESSRVDAAAYRHAGVKWSAGAERVRPSAAPAPPPAPLKSRGGAARDLRTRVTFCLNKVKFIHEVYPLGCKQASRQTLAIGKIEILDQLKDSELNKLLSLYNMPGEPDRRNSHMLMVKATHQRGDSPLSSQECGLKVSLLPLKFHIDQDTLTFLISFFSKLGSDECCDDDTKSLSNVSMDSSGSKQSTPTHRPPVMSIATHLRDPAPQHSDPAPQHSDSADTLTVADDPASSEPLMEAYEAERLVSENLIQLEEDFSKIRISSDQPSNRPCLDDATDDSPIYFRHVVFSPNVPIRLDYVGKHVDLTAGRFGPLTALLLGLGQLNCSELTLKRLYLKTGLLGLEKLIQWALHEWLADIKRNQLPGLLSGIGPMHSVLQLITGIRDLVWLPLEQWRRDGRVVLGLRRGAASFTARTAVAAIDLTSRALHLVQATAEMAFDMLTPGPTLPLQDAYERRQRRRRRRRDHSRHPQDMREGVHSAYQTVREGFADTAATMVLAARCESGVAVLRQLPGAAVTPLALAAAGAADLLGGVRAAIAPDLRRDHADKWRSHALTDSN